MSQQSDQPEPIAGLRERKKAKTKARIQQEAVRLFHKQGYAATTVEQIAAAAEVAPSTLFRYFPTKQDLVLADEYALPTSLLFQAQSPRLPPLQAERRAIQEMLAAMSDDELMAQRDRWMLMLSVPELWAAGLGNISRTIRIMSEQVAQRTERDPDDPAVRTYTGAVFGVMLTVALDWAKDPDMDFPAALDEALACLEQGLPL